MTTGSKPAPTTDGDDRQAALEEFLKRAEQIPGATEAVDAYEETMRTVAVRIVSAQGEVSYSTGGNA